MVIMKTLHPKNSELFHRVVDIERFYAYNARIPLEEETAELIKTYKRQAAELFCSDR